MHIEHGAGQRQWQQAGAGADLHLAADGLLLLAGDAQAADARVGGLVPLQLQRLAQVQPQVACNPARPPPSRPRTRPITACHAGEHCQRISLHKHSTSTSTAAHAAIAIETNRSRVAGQDGAAAAKGILILYSNSHYDSVNYRSLSVPSSDDNNRKQEFKCQQQEQLS